MLTPAERQKLTGMLLRLPGMDDPNVRTNLLIGLPDPVQNNIKFHPAPLPHVTNIVTGVDDPEWLAPPGTDWPVMILIDNAVFMVSTAARVGLELQTLLDILRARAASSNVLPGTDNAPPVIRPIEPRGPEVERMINVLDSFQNPLEWRTQMEERERAVCRVEFPSSRAQGTGFLLGPTVAITNYHVMESVITGATQPDAVVLRFDYKTAADGVTVASGPEYRLVAGDRDTWLLDSSGIAELDYALLRVEPAATVGGTAPQRNWLKPKDDATAPGRGLYILQHPKGDPLKYASDRVVEISPTRIHYATNTNYGSSGSPCFTIEWDLVALHRGYDPDHPDRLNMGSPFTALLQQPKLKAALGT